MLATLTQRMRALFLWLAPEDTCASPALPLTLLVRPLPMFALMVLALNDHWLKGSGVLPGWLTGKLSDFAGLLFFPLLLVTLLNLMAHPFAQRGALLARLASPSTTQVAVACFLTGVFFAGVQLSPQVAAFYGRASVWLSLWDAGKVARVTPDPTDLIALASLLLAFFSARRQIAKVPPGRLGLAAWVVKRDGGLEQRLERLCLLFDDVIQAAGEARAPALYRLLTALAQEAPVDDVDRILGEVRAATPTSLGVAL